MFYARCRVSRERKHRQETGKVLMKLTNRAKWGIATVAIPVLAAALLYVYAILPEKEDIPPLQRAKSGTVHPFLDRSGLLVLLRKKDRRAHRRHHPSGHPRPDRGHLARRAVYRHRGEHHPRRGDLERCGKADRPEARDRFWQRACRRLQPRRPIPGNGPGIHGATCPTTSRSISGMPIAAR